MSDERRDSERVDILGELRGEVTVFQPMTITQIASGGAKVETPFPLQLDSLHEFRLTLGAVSVVVKGRIIHSSISDVEHAQVVYRSEVEFVEPSGRISEVIARFVDALKTDRRSSSA